eukprot:CAMPEP_0177315508 /NCGR_PEP_ID=MMETSP0368-20130122/12497_1 /TAXON_ID=447022 ORGANISM="Scrippsiella hangoei-like, Strain SHHI-4" /NCGR_SAMPLE_ID=MMETSP0368 /ASSEMBLY_ACC=CAM_ASM_000363 /LENGTH=569 /DNA_ID=CAMNT_0018774713 /DNA_START=92 /DNA_END=1802 /DNA_ORIENTATION=+
MSVHGELEPGGHGAGVAGGEDDPKGVTSRYLLVDLAEQLTQDELQNYFSTFGEIAEITMRTAASGVISGSVKFNNPTMELRKLMLQEKHSVSGHNVSVQTWKMQKLAKPGYRAKLDAERAERAMAKGGCGKGDAGKGAWGGWGDWGMMGKGGWGGKDVGMGKGFGKDVGKDFGKGGREFAGGFAGKGGKGPSHKDDDREKDVTARYLLVDLPEDISEDEILQYFGRFGDIEEVTLRVRGSDGQPMGSVKFMEPTPELRHQMLDRKHRIGGRLVNVMTWKMQKMQRPSMQAALMAEQQQQQQRPSPSFGAKGGGGASFGANGGGGRGEGRGAGGEVAGRADGDAGAGGPAEAQQELREARAMAAGGGKGACAGGRKGYGRAVVEEVFADDMYGPVGKAGNRGPAARDARGPAGSAGAKGWGGGPYGGGGWGDSGGKGMAYGAAKGCGKKGGKFDEEKDVTARYLLCDLADHITEGHLRDYFGALGDIEEVSVKALAGGSKIMGSVKFSAPTAELRDIMFKERHEINGCQISVQTWKMQKLQRPGYAAKLAEERAAKGKGGKGMTQRFSPY